ncbi:hypothetical protein ACFQ0T_18635 [Kitasatospora gansuensis]
MEIGQAVQQGLHRGLHDQPGGLLGRADVLARAPGEVCPVAADAVGGEHRGVGVGTGQAEHQHVARADVLAAEHGVAGGPAAGEVLGRRVPPEHLVEGVRDGQPTTRQGGSEPAVGEQQPERVAGPVDGGLVARDHDHHQVVHRLLVGHRGLVGQQPGGQVGGGPLAALPDQVEQDRLELGVGPHRLVAAVHEVADQLDDVRPGRRRQADQLGEHHQRQPAGVLGDQVGGAVRAPAVDQGVGRGLGGLPELPVVDPGQRLGDRRPQPLVLGAVQVEQGGPPGGHRQQPGVRLQPALGRHPPAARVLGEQLLVPGEFEQFGVAEHQPGLHARLQLDRRHRAVLLAQPGVQTVRVLGHRGAEKSRGRCAGQPGGGTAAAVCG